MKNELIKYNNSICRILDEKNGSVFLIDCLKKTMPFYVDVSVIADSEIVSEKELPVTRTLEELSPKDRETAIKRYTMIAPAVSVVCDIKRRNTMIDDASRQYGISKQTVRSFLCSFLAYQNIGVLAPKQYDKESELTADQKNIRWALNKFFYTRNRNSLQTAYTMMLKEKYCDADGSLFSEYPTFNQFRYFYRKNRKMENYYISRDGLSNYQRNNRPLVGDGVQEFAPLIGTAMLDSTICDIYLVDDAGQIIGRPILVVAADANSSLCLGYSLLWEGGTYSLRELMMNIIADKVSLCEQMGIPIKKEQWNVCQLPGKMVTDGGSEYVGQNFEQISELGVILEKLPPYRAELKGSVEKLFDLIQNSYKDMLKGKGVIMPDFQERGSHDYRKDACLSLSEFERIVVKCILYHNNHRIIENYPFTVEMLSENVRPYASDIWNRMLNEKKSNLIPVTQRDLSLTLLPRTNGRFTRFGLKVNKLRYYADGYKEQFLKGGDCIAAYNPDNCDRIWLKEKDGSFIEFSLIESRFSNMSLAEISEILEKQKRIVRDESEENLKAKIELMNFIETVADRKHPQNAPNTKSIRSARSSAKRKNHKDIGGNVDG